MDHLFSNIPDGDQQSIAGGRVIKIAETSNISGFKLQRISGPSAGPLVNGALQFPNNYIYSPGRNQYAIDLDPLIPADSSIKGAVPSAVFAQPGNSISNFFTIPIDLPYNRR